MTSIGFYIHNRDCLSSFAATKLRYRNFTWPTSEHAYQAAKFEDSNIVRKIKSAPSPWEAFEISREYQKHIRPSWTDKERLCAMESILRAKITSNPFVERFLLSTKDYQLFEDSPLDSFWGIGSDGKGQNNLGKIWMKLRDEVTK